MRKFLRNFFWSHGAPLGYLGSLSQKGHPEIFSKWVLINLSNPLRHPAPLVDPLLTKNLDTAGPWCETILIRTCLSSCLGLPSMVSRDLPCPFWGPLRCSGRVCRNSRTPGGHRCWGLSQKPALVSPVPVKVKNCYAWADTLTWKLYDDFISPKFEALIIISWIVNF